MLRAKNFKRMRRMFGPLSSICKWSLLAEKILLKVLTVISKKLINVRKGSKYVPVNVKATLRDLDCISFVNLSDFTQIYNVASEPLA